MAAITLACVSFVSDFFSNFKMALRFVSSIRGFQKSGV